MDNINLSNLSTNPDDVKWLGLPEHPQYQECWQRFYARYHRAILNYIVYLAKWNHHQADQAEEILSRVYEKGFRWSFRRQEGVKFRTIIKRLVRDALSEYWKDKKIVPTEYFCDNQVGGSIDDYPFSVELLKTIIQQILEEYPTKEKVVLQWIWDHDGTWPNSTQLAEMLESKNNAARKWKERNKGLWKKFQLKIIERLKELAWGVEYQKQEVEFFTELEL
ncbi:sigma-70 family RNA polymerase sigma factor [Candidatus Uabimicrobium amorphum]|uniref:Uncharacterized protein n=1 Tax=Uabimicrobium amorphum TaxID=2596890 RepID=A0A5S9F6M6_UABAM|nr:sigma-70 family RNA polymerase sigma factor [Candidatus Uabimicrobium amorphum]BBM87363.1 hypothetical protein UABAM_05772 [Candidatus Uabimicrobium amorphum]